MIRSAPHTSNDVRHEPMLPERWCVVQVRKETHDVTTLTIAPEADGRTRAGIRPGQFLMLSAFGTGEVPISVSGIRNDQQIEHTVRSHGDATRRLCSLRVGDSIGVRGPFGSAWNLERALQHDVLIMAGGIGLAPLKPVIEHVIAHRAGYGSLRVLVGARSTQDMSLRAEIEVWRNAPGAFVSVSVDRPTPDWPGPVGLVTNLLDGLAIVPTRTAAFICGPELMMERSAGRLMAIGIDASRIQLSMERNMKCAIGHCGHCQFGGLLLCRDGPVFDYSSLRVLLAVPMA